MCGWGGVCSLEEGEGRGGGTTYCSAAAINTAASCRPPAAPASSHREPGPDQSEARSGQSDQSEGRLQHFPAEPLNTAPLQPEQCKYYCSFMLVGNLSEQKYIIDKKMKWMGIASLLEWKTPILSSSGPGPGWVKVRCRSGEGQEGQSQVWVMWNQRLQHKLKDLDLSYTLFLVFTHPPTTNFSLGFREV